MNETKNPNGERTWTCFLCQTEYKNTLLYCPKCEIARLHSNNLFDTANGKNKKKDTVKRKRHETFRKKKRRFR